MEVLDLPTELIWEDEMSSQYAFINEHSAEIFDLADVLQYDQIIDDAESIRSIESIESTESIETIDDKWPNQPLPITEPSYDAPFNLYISTGNTIDVSGSPFQDTNQLKESLFNFTTPIGFPRSQLNDNSDATTQNYIVDSSFVTSIYTPTTQLPCEDVARELQLVDELVRLHAQNLPNWADDDSSLASSSTASSSPRSETSDTSSYSSYATKKTGTKSEKKIGRSRNFNSDDKKYRKKEQNKNAANKYRQKKKAEVGIILKEEKQLENKNFDLTNKLADVKREIKYIKNLMRELYRAKGVLD